MKQCFSSPFVAFYKHKPLHEVKWSNLLKQTMNILLLKLRKILLRYWFPKNFFIICAAAASTPMDFFNQSTEVSLLLLHLGQKCTDFFFPQIQYNGRLMLHFIFKIFLAPSTAWGRSWARDQNHTTAVTKPDPQHARPPGNFLKINDVNKM